MTSRLRLAGIAGLGLVALFSGCVQSYHPFCEPASMVAVPELPGEWDVVKPLGTDSLAASTNRPWVCTTAQTGLYEVVTYGTNEVPATILVATFKVADQLYADTTAGEAGDRPSNPYWDSSISRVHNLWKLGLSNDVISLRALDLDWLRHAGQSNLVTLAFAADDDKEQGGRLYTAKPADWLQFLAKWGAQPGVFEEDPSFVLRKQKPVATPAVLAATNAVAPAAKPATPAP